MASMYLESGTIEKAMQLWNRTKEGFQKSPNSSSKVTALQFLYELYLYQSIGMTSVAQKSKTAAQEVCESKSIDGLELDDIIDESGLLLGEHKFAEAVATMKSLQEQTEKDSGVTHTMSLTAIIGLATVHSALDRPIEIERLAKRVALKILDM